MKSRFDFCAGLTNISLLKSAQTGYSDHPASYSQCTETLSKEVKQLVHEANPSPPSSAEAGHVWSYACTLPYVLMVWYLIKHIGNRQNNKQTHKNNHSLLKIINTAFSNLYSIPKLNVLNVHHTSYTLLLLM